MTIKINADVIDVLTKKAKEYNTLEEFLNNMQNIHRPPDSSSGSRLDDLSPVFGDDIYSNNALNYFGDSKSVADKKAIQIIKTVKNNPNASVKIYRAIESGEHEEINAGDWVTTTKEYALQHGDKLSGSKIIEKTVNAKDLYSEGYIQEYGYFPEGTKNLNRQDLTDIWNKAHNKVNIRFADKIKAKLNVKSEKWKTPELYNETPAECLQFLMSMPLYTNNEINKETVEQCIAGYKYGLSPESHRIYESLCRLFVDKNAGLLFANETIKNALDKLKESGYENIDDKRKYPKVNAEKQSTLYLFDFDGVICISEGFSQDYLKNPEPNKKIINKIKSLIDDKQDVAVLSARKNEKVIADFLKENDVPNITIFALGNTSKYAKGQFIKDELESEFDKVILYDDNQSYLDHAEEILKDEDVEFKPVKVESLDKKKINKISINIESEKEGSIKELLRFFKMMESACKVGASREFLIFVDGDGSPMIKMNIESNIDEDKISEEETNLDNDNALKFSLDGVGHKVTAGLDMLIKLGNILNKDSDKEENNSFISEQEKKGIIKKTTKETELNKENLKKDFKQKYDNLIKEGKIDKAAYFAIDILSKYKIDILDNNEKVSALSTNSSFKKSKEFSIKATSSSDAEYLAAVESNDMDKAQSMVDSAAQATGYTIKAYHGTQNKFNEFDINKQNSGVLGKGFYFSNDKSLAKSYSDGKDYMAVYLLMNNPYIINYDKSSYEEQLELSRPFKTSGGQERIKQMGYDSVFLKDKSYKEYVVYYPNQIKSADAVTYDDLGNIIPLSKRFNSGSNDIRAKKVEAIKGLKEDDYINVGQIEEVYENQYRINNKWYNESLIQKIESKNNKDKILQNKISSSVPDFYVNDTINKIIEQNIPLNSDGTITLYHGTTSQNAKKIEKTGFNKFSYFSTSPSVAKNFGNKIIEFRANPTIFSNEGDSVASGNKALTLRNWDRLIGQNGVYIPSQDEITAKVESRFKQKIRAKLNCKAAKQVGNLYHFTSLNNLINILKSDVLNLHSDGWISLTRDFNLTYFGDVRITLDGDKISNNYKIKPFDYFDKKKDADRQDEKEEKIDKPINNIKSYIKQIDYLKYPEMNKEKQQRINAAIDALKIKYNIPINIVEKYMPVKSKYIMPDWMKQKEVQSSKFWDEIALAMKAGFFLWMANSLINRK